MPKKSASEKPKNFINQKFVSQESANHAIDSHAKNFLTDAEMKKFLGAARKSAEADQRINCSRRTPLSRRSAAFNHQKQ
jgi:hypothetical protein